MKGGGIFVFQCVNYALMRVQAIMALPFGCRMCHLFTVLPIYIQSVHILLEFIIIFVIIILKM